MQITRHNVVECVDIYNLNIDEDLIKNINEDLEEELAEDISFKITEKDIVEALSGSDSDSPKISVSSPFSELPITITLYEWIVNWWEEVRSNNGPDDTEWGDLLESYNLVDIKTARELGYFTNMFKIEHVIVNFANSFETKEDAVRFIYNEGLENIYIEYQFIDTDTRVFQRAYKPDRSWFLSMGIPYEELYDENPDIDIDNEE